MRIDGIQLGQGSAISNLTVANGTSFPSQPDEGEMFFRSDAALNIRGLYLYVGGNWDRISSSDSTTVHNGASLPTEANAGDIFYLNSNDAEEALYAYTGSAWLKVAGAAGDYLSLSGGDVTGAVTISLNSSDNGLRINQTGSGNALVVEDSAHPDSTPFVVTSDGRVLVGAPTSEFAALLQIHSTQNSNFNQTVYSVQNSSGNGFRRSRGTTIGENVAVENSDVLGLINFQGANGTDYNVAAAMYSSVDGTPSLTNTPGRLDFYTDGGSGTINRFTIRASGAIGFSGLHGNPGHVLISAGDAAPPTWTALSAASIGNTAAGNIVATTVQAAINELDSEKVSKAGDMMTGPLMIASAFPFLMMNGIGVGISTVISMQKNGVERWSIDCNNTAESGSNAGSNFFIQRYGDGGVVIDTALGINRATGLTTLSSLTVSGTMSGSLTGAASLNVLKAGDTMTGALILPFINFSTSPGLQFVDSSGAGIWGDTTSLGFVIGGATRLSISSTQVVPTVPIRPGATASTVAAPAYSFLDDPDTGMFRDSGTGNLAFSMNGTARLQINPQGSIGFGGANYGTSGQVLTSAGSSGAPTWNTVDAGTLGAVTLSTAQTITGAKTFSAQALFSAGTVAAPSISFTGDPNTGLFAEAADNVSISTGGGRIARFMPSQVVLSNGSSTTPDANVFLTVDRLNGSSKPSMTLGTVAAFIGALLPGSSSHISIISGNGASSSVHFGDTDADAMGRIQYDHTGNAMRFFTSGVERMRLDETSGALRMFGPLLVGSNVAGNTTWIRKYAGGYNATHFPTVPHRIGEITFTGDSQNVTLVGQIRLVSGNLTGIVDFTISLRANVLPVKTYTFEKTYSNAGLNADVQLYEDTATGKFVLTYTSIDVAGIQNVAWDVSITERGNYNYWQQVETNTVQTLTGLTLRAPSSVTKTFSSAINVADVTTSSITVGTVGSQRGITLIRTSTSLVALDTVAIATSRVVKYLVSITRGTVFHYTEITLLHNGTDVNIVEVGTIKTGADLATFSADMTGGMRLLVTPTAATSTTFKVIATAIAV